MAKARDLTNSRHGQIEVIEQTGRNAYRNRVWRCRCLLCGRTDLYRTSSNVTRSYSCGCRVSPKSRRKATGTRSVAV